MTLAADDAHCHRFPAPVAAELLPGLMVPDRFHAIVNAHFAVPGPSDVPLILAYWAVPHSGWWPTKTGSR